MKFGSIALEKGKKKKKIQVQNYKVGFGLIWNKNGFHTHGLLVGIHLNVGPSES